MYCRIHFFRLHETSVNGSTLRKGRGFLKHILSGYKTTLIPAHYCTSWDKFRTTGIDVNQLSDRDSGISFVQNRQKSGHLENEVKQHKIETSLEVPLCIVVTTLRPDMVLFSKRECTAYFIELAITILFKEAMVKAIERKKLLQR